MKKKKKNSGFTVLELVISTAIIVVMLIFVLANYRAAGTSGEVVSALQAILNGFTTTQARGVSGNLVEDPFSPSNKIYPNQGYAIYFTQDLPQQFSLYGLHGVDHLGEETFQDPNISLIALCGLATPAPVPAPIPCSSPWINSIHSAEIIFDLAGDTQANLQDSDGNTLFGFDYVGGVIEHQKTGQQAYFYISLTTGGVSGDIL